MGIERNGSEPIGIVRTTRNLFDESKVVESGYLDEYNEIHSPNNNWKYTDYIPVNGETFTVQIGYPSSGAAICFYDENKTFIRGKTYETATFSITVPNAKYVRMCVSKSYSMTQLELGTEATPYVPHTVSATKVVRTTRNLFDIDKDCYVSATKVNNDTINWSADVKAGIILRNLIIGKEYTISYHVEYTNVLIDTQLLWCLFYEKTATYPDGEVVHATGKNDNIYNMGTSKNLLKSKWKGGIIKV